MPNRAEKERIFKERFVPFYCKSFYTLQRHFADELLLQTNEDGLEDMHVGPEQTLNETITAIIAGADTTSTVLSGTFYYLLTHPAAYERLRAEVDGVFPVGEGEPFDAVKLVEMPYLNAVM